MKQTVILLVAALLLSGCYTTRTSGNAGAVMTGASIGGSVGHAVGGLIGEGSSGWRGAHRGSAIGTILGTVAGAVIANEATKPREEEIPSYEVTPVPRQAQVERIRSASDNRLKIRNIRFIDAGRNQTINSEEDCKIIFEIMNEGDKPAYNVVPVVNEVSGMKRITISPSVLVEAIAPREGVKYTATLSAGKRIKSGRALIRVGVTDEYGREYDWQEFEIPTEK
ncbi:MAG: glycine zipper family protein [Mediterranea massiliensis]|nr:glycine zipper family protein [Mediterranea massiliensis]